jgi:hypothetical protein
MLAGMDRGHDMGSLGARSGRSPGAPTAVPLAPEVRAALALQRSAGNAAVTRLFEGARPHGVSDASVRLLSRSATAEDQASAEHLVDMAGNLTGPWSQLDWTTVAKSAKDRVQHPEWINQNPLGLCGPAAVLNWLAETAPGTFTYDVWSVFEQGDWDGKTFNSTLLGNSAMSGMNQLDWMMLSAMQDNANDHLQYYGRETKWRDGETAGDLKHTMYAWTKIQDTAHYTCVHWGTEEETQKVSDLLREHGDDVCVVMEVDSKTLQNETARGDNDHYIRLRKPVDYGDTVSFDIFTWGSYRSLKFQQDNFNHMVDGYIVGAVRQDIL